MKTNSIVDLLKGKNIIIPCVLIKNKDKLNITTDELVVLGYLMNQNDKIAFDIEQFCSDLGMEISVVMNTISSLVDKKILVMSVIKNKTGMMCEYLDINMLYTKLASFIIDDEVLEHENGNDNSNIYNVIEKEFARTLSPIECETIKRWLDSNISEELITEALKEAVLNGVTNLKYIDKILYEWNKKGITKAVDVKRKNKQPEEEIKLFDYDWLADDEENAK